MLKHVVLFALEGFVSPEAKAAHLEQIKKALEALPDRIPALRRMVVHLNQNPREAYDFVLEAYLDSLDELSLYADHPDHLEIVRELIKPHVRARACIDYTID